MQGILLNQVLDGPVGEKNLAACPIAALEQFSIDDDSTADAKGFLVDDEDHGGGGFLFACCLAIDCCTVCIILDHNLQIGECRSDGSRKTFHFPDSGHLAVIDRSFEGRKVAIFINN